MWYNPNFLPEGLYYQLCEAEDKDYQIAELSDGCADDDREVHLPNYQSELESTGKNLSNSLKINNLQLL
jgi:hypothetical protein